MLLLRFFRPTTHVAMPDSIAIAPGDGFAAQAALIVLSALILLLPAFVNGYPLLNADTLGYLQNGERIARSIATLANHGVGHGGRSIFYSFFVYLQSADRWLWPVIVVQSVIVAHALYVTFRMVLPESRRWLFVAITSVLALATSLPWYASELMPDIYSGLAILSAFLIGLCGHRMGLAGRAYFLLLFTAAILFHTSNLPVAIGLTVVVALLRFFFYRPTAPALAGAAPLLGAVLLSVLLALLSSFLITGRPQIGAINSPPFVMARLIADGPAKAYLQANCATGRFALCRYVDRLPDDAWVFLWGPRRWDFMQAVTPEDEAAIIWGTITTYPLWQFEHSMRNTLGQLLTFGIRDLEIRAVHYPRIQAAYPRLYDAFARSPQFARRLPLATLSTVHYAAAAVSLLVCIALFPHVLRSGRRDLAALAVLVAAGLLFNAAVTGMLSDIAPRYQARVVWLLGFLALLYLIAVLHPQGRARLGSRLRLSGERPMPRNTAVKP